MKMKYIVPRVRSVDVDYEACIATSKAGTDAAQAAYFKYDQEVQINVDEYFEGGWQ